MSDPHRESTAEMLVAAYILFSILVLPVLVLGLGAWCWFYCG